jgi:hypothetical protein
MFNVALQIPSAFCDIDSTNIKAFKTYNTKCFSIWIWTQDRDRSEKLCWHRNIQYWSIEGYRHNNYFLFSLVLFSLLFQRKLFLRIPEIISFGNEALLWRLAILAVKSSKVWPVGHIQGPNSFLNLWHGNALLPVKPQSISADPEWRNLQENLF